MADQASRKRCFIALPVPEELRDELEAIQQRLRAGGSIRGRAIPTDNLHLTLAFLGSLDAGERDRAIGLLGETAAAGERTSQPLDRVHPFPGTASRLLALEGVPAPVLLDLRWRLLERLADAEVPAAGADRPFRPHVSLLRLRQPPESVPEPEVDLTLPVRELVFYESLPGERGVYYEALARFELPA